jgi:hypothetical protein
LDWRACFFEFGDTLRNTKVIGFSNLEKKHRFLITGTAHSGLEVVTANGNRAVLAVLDNNGNVVEAGEHVAETAWEAILAIYRNFLQGNGFMTVKMAPSAINSCHGTNTKKSNEKLKRTSPVQARKIFKPAIQQSLFEDDINSFQCNLTENNDCYFGDNPRYLDPESELLWGLPLFDYMRHNDLKNSIYSS